MSENEKPKVIAVSIAKEKGVRKKNVDKVELQEDYGIVGDAHAGTKNRQVSLLASESIDKMKKKGLDVAAGDFAENITTIGLNLPNLKIDTKLKIGDKSVLQISQIGKVCHERCNIYYQAGDCVMPREGVFASVLKGGAVKPGDKVEVES